MSDQLVLEEKPLYAMGRALLAYPSEIPAVAMSMLGVKYANRAVLDCVEADAQDLYYGEHYFNRDVLRIFEVDPHWYSSGNSWELKVFEAAYVQHWNYCTKNKSAVRNLKPFSPHYD